VAVPKRTRSAKEVNIIDLADISKVDYSKIAFWVQA
jgi:hypothetical protein